MLNLDCNLLITFLWFLTITLTAGFYESWTKCHRIRLRMHQNYNNKAKSYNRHSVTVMKV